MSGDGVQTRLKISRVVRHVHSALIGATTREELEAAVCDAFADSEPYVFAWIGVHDPESDRVRPRAIAGQSPGYLDEISIQIHDPSTAQGPTATAIRTQEVQAIQNIRDDPAYEPWREQALSHGFESSAAVPLVDDSNLYGVLNLYSDRPEAFDARERELLGEVGKTVATAIDGLAARRELEEQKRRYERFTERISDAYYAVDGEWTITYWNDQMAERTDTPADEVLGRSLWEAFPELLGTRNETEYRRAMETKEHRSFETYLEDSYEYWVEIDVYPDEEGLSVFSREITDRKEREGALKRANRRLNALIENTSEAIYIKDREGTYLFMNDAAADLFGIPAEEVVGKHDEDLFDPESTTEIRAVDEKILASGEPDTREAVRYIDGNEHVFLDDKYPYYDEDDEIIGIMGVSRDITERKRYERQLKEQRDLLEVLNEIVRHDIRNNLQLIMAYSDMLSEHVSPDGERYLEIVRKNAGSAVELTHSAAELAKAIKNPDQELSATPLDRVLETQLEELRETSTGATITVDGELPQARVLADDMLASLFRNLFRNATQHNDKESPQLTVSVTEAEDSVRIEVADNGPGIPPEDRTRIFGEGEKGLESQGTGIGLYLVRTLIERYGGDVHIKDNTPEGAVFVVTLPTAG